MGKNFLVLLIGMMFLGVSHAKNPEPLDLPVCRVARAKTAYTGTVAIPDQVKSHIAAYKKSWRDLCDRKPGASLPQTLRMAKALEERFEPIYASTVKQTRTADGEGDWKKLEAAHDYLQKDLPKFIPAFEGSFIEWRFFKPEFSDFKTMAKYGSAEDRRFFRLLPDFPGETTLPPWYEATWDHGGCLRFGEFDWIQAFQKLEKGKKLKTVQYKKLISKQDSLLTETLKEFSYKYSDGEFASICTCKKKDAVRTDLNKLVGYLKTSKTYNYLAISLQNTIKAITVGQIPVKSQAEKHCSGG